MSIFVTNCKEGSKSSVGERERERGISMAFEVCITIIMQNGSITTGSCKKVRNRD